jgi:hypothetical protein
VTQNTDLVAVPGGGAIKINCGSFGFDFGFREPTGGALAYDVFRDTISGTSQQGIAYTRLQPNSGDPGSFPQTQNTMTIFDVSSNAGYAHVTAFGHYDTGTNSCTAKARGWSSP